MNDFLPDLFALIGLICLGAGVYLSLGLAMALCVVGANLILLGVLMARSNNVTQ